MIYYLIFVLLTMLALYNVYHPYSKCSKGNEFSIVLGNRIKTCISVNWMLLFLTTVLVVFSAIRWDVGIDFGTYQNSFTIIKGSGDSSLVDISFVVLSKLLPSLTAVFAFYALFSTALSVNCIKIVSPYIYLSLLLFYGLYFIRYDMGIIRQGLAMAITFNSIKYANENNLTKFLVSIAIAALFHGSAVCFVVVYFIVDKKIPAYIYFCVTGVCAFIGFTGIWRELINIISYLPIPMISKYMAHLANSQYLNYSFSFTDMKDFLLFTLFIIYLGKISNESEEKEYRSLLNIFFIGVCVYFAFRPFVTVSDRGAAYFCMTEILLIPFVVKYTKNKSLKALLLVLACLYSCRSVYTNCNYISDSWMNCNYVPYKTIFEK